VDLLIVEETNVKKPAKHKLCEFTLIDRTLAEDEKSGGWTVQDWTVIDKVCVLLVCAWRWRINLRFNISIDTK